MKKLVLLLLLLAGCAKEHIDNQIVQLTVDGSGTYMVTYGINDQVTVKGLDKWSTSFWATPGETVNLSVATIDKPATLYMTVSVDDGVLFCRSLFIQPQSSGMLSYLVKQP